jgi:uncharacterized protein with von Willebrand factor type A (vWA) domain
MADFESPKTRTSGGTPQSEVQSILSRYTHDEQRIILHNLETLASMAQYMGQDFEMKVLLNRPGDGWHWNFAKNEVRVDPETMLTAPLEVSKAIYCHEGFHRRITPKDGVPEKEWNEPGLPFLVNSIEDPRIENFGGDAYPAYRPIRDASYRHHIESVSDKVTEKLGRVPRHIQAGKEIIHQWFREAQGKPFEVPDALDPLVKTFVEEALSHAQDAWFRYPTRAEADWEPEKVSLYFKDAYQIIRKKIWPEFKKLYEQDQQDQLLDEAMRGLQGKGADGGGESEPDRSNEPLTEQEARDLLKAAKDGTLKVGKGDPGNARPLDLSKLPADLKQEIADYVKGLPRPTRENLKSRGDVRLKEASDAASAALEGKANQEGSPVEGPDTDPKSEPTGDPSRSEPTEDFSGIDLSELRRHVTIPPEETAIIHEEFQHLLNQDLGLYHNTVREIAPTINQLENDLRAIFQKRRQSHRESGRRSGPSLNINRFIAERASGRPAIETKAFEAKTRPLERDYAVLILVDVSGSMEDKIHPAFAATVACTEALSRLKIQHAIYGFNDALHPYKLFDEKTDPIALEKIEGEVLTRAAAYNNDGWAIQQVAKKLMAAKERERILIVLSDGEPVPSSKYSGEQYELKKTTRQIEEGRKIRLMGLGMGPGTEHVDTYYSNSRANIPIEDLPHELSTVLREAIGQD